MSGPPEYHSLAKVTKHCNERSFVAVAPLKSENTAMSGPPEYHSLAKVTKHCNERSAGAP